MQGKEEDAALLTQGKDDNTAMRKNTNGLFLILMADQHQYFSHFVKA